MLQELAKDLWVVGTPLRFGGLEIGSRMTVVRLTGGALFLHSPIALDRALRGELDALGQVSFVVGPNRFHHLHLGDYAKAYPDAALFAAPGLETKRKDLQWEAVLGDDAPTGWSGQIDQLFFRGFPVANEVAFFHPASRTLIVSDLAFNIGAEASAMTRLAFRALRAYERFGPSILERLLIRDRTAARKSLERILEWDFDRVILAHGRVRENAGRDGLRAGYAWLLGA